MLVYFMAASQSLGCRSHLDLHPSAVRHSGVPGPQCHHIVLCSSPLHPFAFHTSFLLFSGPPECSLCHAPTWVPVTTLKDLRFKLWQASLQKLPWLKSGCEQQEMGQGGRISLVAKARAHGEACKVGAGGVAWTISLVFQTPWPEKPRFASRNPSTRSRRSPTHLPG